MGDYYSLGCAQVLSRFLTGVSARISMENIPSHSSSFLLLLLLLRGGNIAVGYPDEEGDEDALVCKDKLAKQLTAERLLKGNKRASECRARSFKGC
ncbi:hypothetical protein [Kiloniella sp. EL199]|uniref:hypothetical protein n=1 Tax=Kiloniella sp. EL199 TaxID=2107581 RepID=UPI0013C4EFCF|nr:hypothetical protein [Kiloniella sp. EL199]